MYRSSGRKRSAISVSLTTSIPRCSAATITGASGGTPGLTTTRDAAERRFASCPPSSTATPSASRSLAVTSRSGVRLASVAYTRLPPRASSVATERPLRARPITAISPRSQSARSAGSETRGDGMSAQLERAHREHGKQDRNDPEPDDHLILMPTLQLEMVVQRRAQEEPVLLRVLESVPPLPVLEEEPLPKHRDRLDHEDEADEDQQEFRLEQNGDGSERAAERQRTGIAHEHLRRIRVVPQKADQRSDHRGAKDGELPGVDEIEDAEITARVDASDDVGKDRERRERDGAQPRRETIHPVGEIHRVAHPHQDERREEDVDPLERSGQRNDKQVLVEWQGGRRARQVRRQGKLPEVDAEEDADGHLPRQLVALDESLVFLTHALLPQLQHVVEEPDGAHPRGDDRSENGVAAGQSRPEKDGEERGKKDDESAHRGRRPLGLMRIGGSFTHHLMDQHRAQPAQDDGSDDEGQQERRDRCSRRPERDVRENVQERVVPN